MLTRHLALLVALVAVVVGSSRLVDHPEPTHGPPVSGHAARSHVGCPPGEGGRSETTDDIESLPAAIRMSHNGFRQAHACGPGTLTMTLSGSLFAGEGPHVVVMLGRELVWEASVASPTTVEVEVPGNTRVAIGFLNDASGLNGDRNLWIENLAFVRH